MRKPILPLVSGIDYDIERPLKSVKIERPRLLEAVEYRGPSSQAYRDRRSAVLELEVERQTQDGGQRRADSSPDAWRKRKHHRPRFTHRSIRSRDVGPIKCIADP